MVSFRTFGTHSLYGTHTAISGIALENSIQTKEFVQQWHKENHNLWIQQAGFDKTLYDTVEEIQYAVVWLGEQFFDVQRQLMLKCGWNATQFV